MFIIPSVPKVTEHLSPTVPPLMSVTSISVSDTRDIISLVIIITITVIITLLT